MLRVRSNLGVVLAMPDGSKRPARVVDIGLGGMHVSCDSIPGYGAGLIVVVRLDERSDWLLLPGTVRWFTRGGFGIEFEALSESRAKALAAFVDHAVQ